MNTKRPLWPTFINVHPVSIASVRLEEDATREEKKTGQKQMIEAVLENVDFVLTENGQKNGKAPCTKGKQGRLVMLLQTTVATSS